MTCPNCGAQISDDAKFCGSCGTSINTNPAADSTTPQANENETANQPSQANSNQFQPEPNPSSSENAVDKGTNFIKTHIPLIIGGIAAFFVLIVVVIVLSVVLFGKPYKKPIDAALKFRNSQSTDIKKYCSSFNGNELIGQLTYDSMELITDLQLDDMDEDESIEDSMEELLHDYYDEVSDIYGDDWEITYDIKRVKEIRESKLDEYQENWEDAADSLEDSIDDLEDNDEYSDDDIDELTKFLEKWSKKFANAKVTKGYRVTVRMTIKGDEDKKSETDEIIVLKVGGKWIAESGLSSLLYELTEQDFDYYNFNLKGLF